MGYDDLARAAKALRIDPARYQPVAGIEYERGPLSLFRWEIQPDTGPATVGLLGVYPLQALVPHEATTAAALTRPRHPVQIRPVMALIDSPLPAMEDAGPTLQFVGTHRHTVTPVVIDGEVMEGAVIADGHHRTAAALRVGGDPGIMTFVVSTTGATLEAGAFHRVFARPASLPDAIEGCRVFVEPPETALEHGRIAVVTPRGALGVRPEPASVPEPLHGIPAGVAHRLVLPALGLDERDAVYLDDIDAALAAAQYGTAILLPGSDVRSVVIAARTGVDLPPKSTRFRPKPLRGLVMRQV